MREETLRKVDELLNAALVERREAEANLLIAQEQLKQAERNLWHAWGVVDALTRVRRVLSGDPSESGGGT